MQTTRTNNSPQTGDKGLKSDAIGFLDTLIIGLASTAPAYSLAAVIGLVVVENSGSAPGQAAVLSTVILLVTYVCVTVVAFAGLGRVRRGS